MVIYSCTIKFESALKSVSYIKVWAVLVWFTTCQVNAGNRNATQMGCNFDSKWHILVLIDWELSLTLQYFDLEPFTAPGLRSYFARSQHHWGGFRHLLIFLLGCQGWCVKKGRKKKVPHTRSIWWRWSGEVCSLLIFYTRPSYMYYCVVLIPWLHTIRQIGTSKLMDSIECKHVKAVLLLWLPAVWYWLSIDDQKHVSCSSKSAANQQSDRNRQIF